MIKLDRRRRILDLLYEKQSVQVSQLTEQFGVSIETIRRDLEELEQHQQLVRVYGGAILPPETGTEPAYRIRSGSHSPEKRAIAARAAELIHDGETVFIDLGTTNYELARAILGKKRITVLTNALKVAALLAEDPNIRVIIPGGETRGDDLALYGSMTTRMLSEFNTDLAFLGVGGFSLKQGLTAFHPEEAEARKVLLSHSSRVIALLDSSKLGLTAMNVVCSASDISTVITDSGADRDCLQKLRQLGLEVLVAEDAPA